MLIFDSHLDLAWNALSWNRDLTATISEIRRSECGMSLIVDGAERRGRNTVSLPEMQKANVAVCLATLLARASERKEALLDYRNAELCWAMAQGQLAYYRLMERNGVMRMLKDRQSLDAHIQEWQSKSRDPVPVGFILSMEGADPILWPGQVEEWWNDGLRVVEPVHFGVSAYSRGTGSPGAYSLRGETY